MPFPRILFLWENVSVCTDFYVQETVERGCDSKVYVGVMQLAWEMALKHLFVGTPKCGRDVKIFSLRCDFHVWEVYVVYGIPAFCGKNWFS